MPCFSPLHGFPYPSTCSRAGQYMIYSRFIDKPDMIDESTGEYLHQIDIRCGKCAGCRLDDSKEWATRMVVESFTVPEDTCYFITLTYNNDFVPKSDNGDMVLDPPAVSSWMKRLRRNFEYYYGHKGVRFYACGEYGSKGMRPHYHVCLFNSPLDDLSFAGLNKLGDPLYTSDFIDQAWSKEITSSQRLSFGGVCIGKMNWRTCAYTARYTMKKAYGSDKEDLVKLGLVPEFVNMSRRPGIGLDYFLANYDTMYDRDQIILPAISKDKANIQRIPKYFDKKMKEIDPLRLAQAKERRIMASELAHQAKMANVGLEEEEYFELESRRCTDRLMKLVREL